MVKERIDGINSHGKKDRSHSKTADPPRLKYRYKKENINICLFNYQIQRRNERSFFFLITQVAKTKKNFGKEYFNQNT